MTTISSSSSTVCWFPISVASTRNCPARSPSRAARVMRRSPRAAVSTWPGTSPESRRARLPARRPARRPRPPCRRMISISTPFPSVASPVRPTRSPSLVPTGTHGPPGVCAISTYGPASAGVELPDRPQRLHHQALGLRTELVAPPLRRPGQGNEIILVAAHVCARAGRPKVGSTIAVPRSG